MPLCLSPRPNLLQTPPLQQASVSTPLPWNQKEGVQHSHAGEGAGGANSDDWRKSLSLCLLRDCTCDYGTQNTYCAQCLSPLLNWDPPPPLPQASVPPRTKGGGGHHRLSAKGEGGPNSDDWRKCLVLCIRIPTLWSYIYFKNAQSISYFPSIYRFIQMSRVIGK